jgi:uncharacterized protein (DUF362 family)
MTCCFSKASTRVKELVRDQLLRWGGNLKPKKIVLKPNWVLHQTDPAFPIEALVTDARVIEAAVEACLDIYPGAESILVADCPLQYADWPRMIEQCGLGAMIRRLEERAGEKLRFCDLRREIFVLEEGNFMAAGAPAQGDPKGYREVELGGWSHLEAISDQADLFAVNDYSSSVTRSNHGKGSHRYLVSQSILEADLFINLPKWKSHQKSGITCALKNLVGVNVDKAYLPHFRRGAPKWGGDEFRDEQRWLYYAQTRLRERFQKQSKVAYKLLKPGWELIKKARGIETRMTGRAPGRNFYLAGGSWHGNQTIWRMIYDLNFIVQCVDMGGRIHSLPQRHYFCIVDGLVSGEGNGPLQPLPRTTDWLVFGGDPFQIDAALSWFMGFDSSRIPLIDRRGEFAGPVWGDFAWAELAVEMDGIEQRVMESPINFGFAPPPGWRNYIER